jgi:arabinofuranosyltransferase
MNKFADRTLPLALTLLACLGYAYALVLSAWLCDDAFISFRVVDNLIHGRGLVWNVDERVQTFTNTLWTLLVSLAYWPFRNIVLVAFGLSFGCALAGFALLLRNARGPWAMACAALLALGSKAFVDYSTSGLENPLLYLLLGLFFTLYLGRYEEKKPNDALALWTLASLAYLTRQDTILLCFPALAHVFLRSWAVNKGAALRQAALGLTPALAWTAFSLVYYGFIFPNTYYAKVDLGISRGLLLRQGLAYFWVNFRYDPVTLGAILAALAASIFSGRRSTRVASLGIGLYLLYVFYIGADYMAGRFLSYALLIAGLVLGRIPFGPWTLRGAAAALLFYALLWPYAPSKTDAGYEQQWKWQDAYGISDERGFYFQGAGLVTLQGPDWTIRHSWATNGLDYRSDSMRFAIMNCLGYFGFYAGPNAHILDVFGLADPLMARLQPTIDNKAGFRPGHLSRAIPQGYKESLSKNENRIVNPIIKEYYQRLRLLSRGELWSKERFAAMIEYNLKRKKLSSPPRVVVYETSRAPLREVGFDFFGLLVKFEQPVRPESMELDLDPGTHQLCYCNQDDYLVCKELIIGDERGTAPLLLQTPDEARARGFDSLRLEATKGVEERRLLFLKLYDQTPGEQR